LDAVEHMHEIISGSEMYIFKGKGDLPSITAADRFSKILKGFITTGKLMTD